MITEKTCSRCEKSKSIDDFYAFRYGKDGAQAWCKKCMDTNRNRVRAEAAQQRAAAASDA